MVRPGKKTVPSRKVEDGRPTLHGNSLRCLDVSLCNNQGEPCRTRYCKSGPAAAACPDWVTWETILGHNNTLCETLMCGRGPCWMFSLVWTPSNFEFRSRALGDSEKLLCFSDSTLNIVSAGPIPCGMAQRSDAGSSSNEVWPPDQAEETGRRHSISSAGFSSWSVRWWSLKGRGGESLVPDKLGISSSFLIHSRSLVASEALPFLSRS